MNILFILSAFFISSFQNLNPSSNNVDLTITITNIKKSQGSIELGIFNSSSTFLEKGKEFKFATKMVKGNQVVFTFHDIPKDEYAIALYHDVNSDKECNVNFMGIPVEPYGFSNNFKPKFSKPKFKDCKFLLEKPSEISIKLLH